MVYGELEQMSDLEYKVLFPKEPSEVHFMKNTLSFGIEHLKSRLPCSVYFILHLYDENNEEIGHEIVHIIDHEEIVEIEPVYEFKSRWIVDNTYSTYFETFNINQEFVDRSVKYQIELRFDGVTSENPCYFNGLMFNEGEWDGYHKPYEMRDKVVIGFQNTGYVNLYDDDNETFLQVIRPNQDGFNTSELTGSGCTVLAPHIPSEPSVDDPLNLYLEFINQTEQRIDVLR